MARKNALKLVKKLDASSPVRSLADLDEKLGYEFSELIGYNLCCAVGGLTYERAVSIFLMVVNTMNALYPQLVCFEELIYGLSPLLGLEGLGAFMYSIGRVFEQDSVMIHSDDMPRAFWVVMESFRVKPNDLSPASRELVDKVKKSLFAYIA